MSCIGSFARVNGEVKDAKVHRSISVPPACVGAPTAPFAEAEPSPALIAVYCVGERPCGSCTCEVYFGVSCATTHASEEGRDTPVPGCVAVSAAKWPGGTNGSPNFPDLG
jgi:hypothetical protein